MFVLIIVSAGGTIEHLVLLVVSCWTKIEDTWSGKCLGLMFFLGGGAGIMFQWGELG